MRVRLSAGAQAYLRRETAYLRQHSSAAAVAFVQRMRKARELLGRHAGLGSLGSEYPVQGLRRLFVGDYRLVYEVTDNEVHVLTIRHGRQDAGAADLEDDADYEVPPSDAGRA